MPKRRATTQPDTTESEGTSAPSGLRRSTRRKIQAAAIEEHGSRDVARKNPVEKKSNPKSKAVDPEFGNTAENKHDQTKVGLRIFIQYIEISYMAHRLTHLLRLP